MKYRYIIVAFLLSILITGCSDWLAVNPRTETPAEKLFKTQDGFKAAHTGSYMLLINYYLYGNTANMLFPESLARHWDINASYGAGSAVYTQNLVMREMSKFNYKHMDVEGYISNMWLKYYNAIVQLNNTLENLETTSATFSHDNDKLIQGEALGLRAFLHLELLRYFGSIPGEGEIGIPYVTRMTKEVDALQSKPFSEVIALIEKDLNESEAILAEIDPIVLHSNYNLNTAGTTVYDNLDEWQTKRQGRFNYFAVLGTKARLYNWIGDKENAVLYAQMVIDAKNENETTKFPLTIASTLTNQVFYGEHLFGLHNPQLTTSLEGTFGTEIPLLTQVKARVEEAYETANHSSDIRYSTNFWEEIEYPTRKAFHFRKYIGTSKMASIKRIPLLRVAEMFLIVIENAEFNTAKETLVEFAKARSLKYAEFELITSESAILPILEREHRKEFYGEGQMLFFYKRHNYTKYTWPNPVEVPLGAYVIPKPEGQLAFE